MPLNHLVEEILRIRGQGTDYKEILIAGEFGGEKIQKGVALQNLSRFYAIFNVRIDGQWVGDLRDYRTVSLPEHRIFNVVEVGPVWEVTIPNVDDVSEVARFMAEETIQVGLECPFALNVGSIRGPGQTRV